MDFSSVIGFFGGMIVVTWGIWLGGYMNGYMDGPSIVIVCGGALMSVMASQPFGRLTGMLSAYRCYVFPKRVDRKALATQLVEFATIARRDGILALENHVDEENTDRFVVTGIRMAVDGTDPDLIERLLMAEIATLEDRHKRARTPFELFGKYCPAFGMIGTLIGLVAMLANLDDPTAIGPGMATALLTTLYGAVLAYVLLIPVADKLAYYSREEVQGCLLVLQGVMAIQSGDNPRIVAQKLNVFLPPADRSQSI